MTRYSLSVIVCQFLQDIIKIDQKQMKQELERRSTLENRNWSDRSSRSTTTTPLSKSIMLLSWLLLTNCGSPLSRASHNSLIAPAVQTSSLLEIRGVPRIWEGGAKKFFFHIWEFACREATCCAWRSHAHC